MVIVRNDFYVEDEPVEDVKRAWKTGQPVLVLPSRLRRRAAKWFRKFRAWAADELRHAAQRADPLDRSSGGARR